MKYIALLRGINVGTSKRIDMKSLKELFENNDFTNVSTYINSGNVLFESEKSADEIQNILEKSLFQKYEENIKVLIKNKNKIIKIANAIPIEWANDEIQKTDIGYLFKEADKKDIINLLPVKKDYLEIIYIKGALIWNVKRENYNKSQLNKLAAHKIYQQMTIRNVNTARYLAFAVSKK